MKVAFLIVAALVIAGSVIADYKWRRWMTARRREQEDPRDPKPR